MSVCSCSITVNIKIIIYGTKIRHFKSKKFNKRKKSKMNVPVKYVEVLKKKGNLEDSMIIQFVKNTMIN